MPYMLSLLAASTLIGVTIALVRRRRSSRCAHCGTSMPSNYGDPLCLVCRLDDAPAHLPTSDTPDADRLLEELARSATR